MAGNRSKDWGKNKKFREGQAEQVLDTLFFDFIDLAKELQPKVVVAENVKGLLQGNAKEYVKEIYKQFDAAGYYCQHWLLDASKMGVPQRRERVFFICLRKDLAKPFLVQKDMFTQVPKLDLNFNENPILFEEIKNNIDFKQREKLNGSKLKHWLNANSKNGRSYKTKNNTKFGFFYKCIMDRVCATITSGSEYAISQSKHLLLDSEFIKIGSFPKDYDFNGNRVQYIIGMSVPPVMISNIVTEIYEQWLNKL